MAMLERPGGKKGKERQSEEELEDEQRDLGLPPDISSFEEEIERIRKAEYLQSKGEGEGEVEKRGDKGEIREEAKGKETEDEKEQRETEYTQGNVDPEAPSEGGLEEGRGEDETEEGKERKREEEGGKGKDGIDELGVEEEKESPLGEIRPTMEYPPVSYPFGTP